MSKTQGERAKKFLLQAKNFMQENKYEETIDYATAGLEVILMEAKQGEVRRLRTDDSEGLYEITICSYLGIDIEEYVRYRKMAGYREVKATGEEIEKSQGGFTKIVKLRFDEKDAKVSLDYCEKTIRRIEETLERLKKPLSSE
jgi:hypothetical protein